MRAGRGEFLVILSMCTKPEVLSPESDLRPLPCMLTRNRTEREELKSGLPVQNLNNLGHHGQNLSSTSGKHEFFAQQFFKIPASGCLGTRRDLNRNIPMAPAFPLMKNTYIIMCLLFRYQLFITYRTINLVKL